MGERRGTKGLELWCKKMTEGYPGVKIDNMTTSWRDGLAFCAMIHHFRPELIDFAKLNKDDVYRNNELAFRVAEQYLGIPALLDAEDMVEYAVPDRLSILTYLSQFYQAFEVSRGSASRVVPKRPATVPDRGIVSPASTSPPTKMTIRGGRANEGLPPRKPCDKCGLPVFIGERLTVGKLLFHRTCFRCARCDNKLTPANYYETETNKFCCETCPDEIAAAESLTSRSISDEEKSILKETTMYKTALEYPEFEVSEANSDSEFVKARSFFMNTQLEDSPPTLPKSKPPESVTNNSEVLAIGITVSVNSNVKSKNISTKEVKTGSSTDSSCIIIEDSTGDSSCVFIDDPPAPIPNDKPQQIQHQNFDDNNKLKTTQKHKPPDQQSVDNKNISTNLEIVAADVEPEERKEKIPNQEKTTDYSRPPSAVPEEELLDFQKIISNLKPVKRKSLEKNKPPSIEAKEIVDEKMIVEDVSKVCPKIEITPADTRLHEPSRVKTRRIEDISVDTNHRTEDFDSIPKSKITEESKPRVVEESKPILSEEVNSSVVQEFESEVPEEPTFELSDETNSRVVEDHTSKIVEESVSINPEESKSRFHDELKTQEDSLALTVDPEKSEETICSIPENPEIIIQNETAVEDETSRIYEEQKTEEFDEEVKSTIIGLEEEVEYRTVEEPKDLVSELPKEPTSKTPVEPKPRIPAKRKSKMPTEPEPKIPLDPKTVESQVISSQDSDVKLEYPEDLNPFDDEVLEKSLNPFEDEEDDDQEVFRPQPKPRSKKISNISKISSDKAALDEVKSTNPFEEDESDDDGYNNPFGDDDDEEEEVEAVKQEIPKVAPRDFNKNKNSPFDSEDEDNEDDRPKNSTEPPEPKPRSSATSVFSEGSLSSNASSAASSTAPSLRKKKAAPRPPIPFDKQGDSPRPSTSLHASPSPRSRKVRRAPLPPHPTSTPLHNNAVYLDDSFNSSPIVDNTLKMSTVITRTLDPKDYDKNLKDETNRNRQSESNMSYTLSAPNKSTYGKWKRKKGQAPLRPVPIMREVKPLPLVELRNELDTIEIQLQGLGKQTVRLEEIIREKCEGPDTDPDSPISEEAEDLIIQMFELINEKNELVRRQAELMYLQRQQRLEREHAEVEYEIRCLMLQPEENKTDFDKEREEELINRLVDIVERRNEVIECLEMDRRRAAEEDRSINTSMNSYTSKIDESLSPNSKENLKKKKKFKNKFKLKGSSSPKDKIVDADKDVDESEANVVSNKVKKKKFNLF